MNKDSIPVNSRPRKLKVNYSRESPTADLSFGTLRIETSYMPKRGEERKWEIYREYKNFRYAIKRLKFLKEHELAKGFEYRLLFEDGTEWK